MFSKAYGLGSCYFGSSGQVAQLPRECVGGGNARLGRLVEPGAPREWGSLSQEAAEPGAGLHRVQPESGSVV